MTARDVLARWTPPRGCEMAAILDELPDDPRLAWRAFSSWTRWLELPQKLVVRRANIRRIARMRRRKMGLPFSENGGLRRW